MLKDFLHSKCGTSATRKIDKVSNRRSLRSKGEMEVSVRIFFNQLNSSRPNKMHTKRAVSMFKNTIGLMDNADEKYSTKKLPKEYTL